MMARSIIFHPIVSSCLLLIIIISGIKCDIHCYCNQPVCVRTGYMCKSKGQQAGCFVEHSGFGNMDRSSDISRHGCIEMLPNDQRVSCLELALAIRSSHHHSISNHHRNHHHIHIHRQQQPNNHQISSNFRRTHNKTITCCLDDMCNYVKTIIDDSNDSDFEHSNQQQRPPIISSSNDHHFDSLGKQLQESYGSMQGYSLIVILIFIMTPLVLLVIFIYCVIWYIRKDDQKKKFTKQPRSNSIDHHHHKQQKHNHNVNKFSIKSKIHPNNNKSKHGLLLNVKVDVNNYPFAGGENGGNQPSLFTQLDDTETFHYHESLPNIISGHNLPTMAPSKDYTIEFDKQHPNETTFLAMSGLSDKNRIENKNTIYMSPPTPLPSIHNHTKFSSNTSTIDSNHLDLISETLSMAHSNRTFIE